MMQRFPRKAACLLVLAGCGGARLTRNDGMYGAAARYTFTVDESLSRLTTRLCFAGPPPAALMPIHDEASRRLRRVSLVDSRARAKRPIEVGPRIDLGGIRPGECVEYEADLRGAGGAFNRARGAIISSTTEWLWAPEPRDTTAKYAAVFRLPDGMTHSPIWPTFAAASEELLELDEKAFRYMGNVAIGRLTMQRVPVPGACITAVSPVEGDRVSAALETAWLTSAGRATAQILGHFPAANATVLSVPVRRENTPVMFGIATRGAIPAVSVLVGDSPASEALIADWTAVHEFIHLASPFVDWNEAWLSEGLATYYQEVVRAREGLITPQAAWRALKTGFARGRSERTGRTLREDTAQVYSNGAYTRVYWTGAAIAFLADVEYRRSSRGAHTLDEAMRRAEARIGETLTAQQLMVYMDGELGGTFANVAARYLDSTEFPDVETAFDWLAVEHLRGGAHDTAEVDTFGAETRDAIMRSSIELAPTYPCR